MKDTVDPENLPVYRDALDIYSDVRAFLSEVTEEADVRRQLREASNSIVLNIAEGAGEYRPAEKARFYRIARRSATESVAAVDMLDRSGFSAPKLRANLISVVKQLVGLIKFQRERAEEERGRGKGRGSGR